MSLNSSTTTVLTHKSHNQSSSGWTQPSLAPLLALSTRRDLNRVNDSSQFSVPMINTLSPSWLQRQVNVCLVGLRRRSGRFQCAPHDLPPNRIIKERVDLIRSCGASLTFLVPASLLRRRCPRLTLFRVLFDTLVVVVGGHCDRSSFQPSVLDLVGRYLCGISTTARGWCCMLAAPLVRFTLEQRQCQPPREEPSVWRTCQTRCMRQQRAGELLLIKVHQSSIIRAPTQSNRKYASYLEIRVRRRPAARANSGTDAIVDNVRELCFHGTEQSTPRSRRNCWAVNDGVEDVRSGGMPCEREQLWWWQRFDTTGM
jgi:hypothetical protein